MLDILRNKLGYYVPEPQILNSKDFGVPQNRRRIYIVGFKDEVAYNNFKYPEATGRITRVGDILEKNVNDWYFLSQRYYEGLLKHAERHKAKGQGFGLQILDINGISNTLVVGNMGRERNLVQDEIRGHFYKEGMDRASTKNDAGVRKLTIRECANLQGFPKRFSFAQVSKTQAYKQLGNTVSVPAIKAVANEIRKSLNLSMTLPGKSVTSGDENLRQELLGTN
jgi:DNA (cytosine-5)-methyltransferase 1